MRDMLIKQIVDIYITFYQNVNEAVALLTQGLRDNASVSATINQVTTVTSGIALSVISLLFLVDLIQNTLLKADELRWEDVLKVLLKLLIAKSICSYMPSFLEAIYLKISSAITTIGVTMNAGNVEVIKITQLINDAMPTGTGIKDCIAQIAFYVSCQLPNLIMGIGSIIIKVMAYGRLIELYILLAISPIPCGFIPWKGTSDIPKRFVLNFVAVSLQGLVIVVCCKIYNALVTGITYSGSSTTVILNMTIMACVLIFTVVVSGKWAKQLVGIA